MAPTETDSRSGRTQTPAVQKCSGSCGRTLPLSSFLPDKLRKSGRRSDCKDCYRQRRGPRGKEGRQARDLERQLLELQGVYVLPSLSDVISRALEEVRQIGATGGKFDEQVYTVRRAVEVHGCRTSAEVVEETQLSRWVAERALEKLVADGVLEPRNGYLLEVDADEPGRPPTEYHPADSPRGEVFTHILHRRAADDDLL